MIMFILMISPDLNSGEQALHTVEHMPLLGECIELPSGSILQRPHPDTLLALQAIDDRVRYFPADTQVAHKASASHVFDKSVNDLIGQQIHRDFGGEPVAVRGTTAALTERFPFWNTDNGGLADMQTVLDILQTGSDTGKDRTRVGFLQPDEGNRLNLQTRTWLRGHIGSVQTELRGDPQGEGVFPVVIVYKEDAFSDETSHGWRDLTGERDKRIAALYITDKVERTNRPDNSDEAQAWGHAGRTALGSDWDDWDN